MEKHNEITKLIDFFIDPNNPKELKNTKDFLDYIANNIDKWNELRKVDKNTIIPLTNLTEDLINIDFKDADLSFIDFSHSDLSQVKSLQSSKLANSRLAGTKLPENFIFDGLEKVQQLSNTCKTIFLSLFLVCFYTILTISENNHVALLTNSTQSKLPIIDVEVPIVWFYAIVPVLITFLYYYYRKILEFLTMELIKLPDVFPDGKNRSCKVYPSVINKQISLLIRDFLITNNKPSLKTSVSWILGHLLLNLTPLLIILAVWFECLPLHDWWLSWPQIVIIIIYLCIYFYSYRRYLERMKNYYGKDYLELFFNGIIPENLFKKLGLGVIIIVPVILLVISFSTSHSLKFCLPILHFFKLESSAIISGENISKNQNISSENTETSLKDFSNDKKTSNLDNSDKRRKPLIKNIANLKNKNLMFLYVTNSYLDSADFSESNLQKAKFNNVLLDNAKFIESDLYGVTFIDCTLINANFNNTHTQNIKPKVFWFIDIPDLTETLSSFIENNSKINREDTMEDNSKEKNPAKLTFENCDFEGAKFKGANIENVIFKNEKELKNLNFNNVNSFKNVDFVAKSISNIVFSPFDKDKDSLELNTVNFDNSATLFNIQFFHVNLTNTTGLTLANLFNCRIDDNTILPENIINELSQIGLTKDDLIQITNKIFEEFESEINKETYKKKLLKELKIKYEDYLNIDNLESILTVNKLLDIVKNQKKVQDLKQKSKQITEKHPKDEEAGKLATLIKDNPQEIINNKEILKEISKLDNNNKNITEVVINVKNAINLQTSEKLRKKALEIAEGEIGVEELTGNNDGPRIEEYQEHLAYLKNQGWSTSFVSWCYKEAAEELNIQRPFTHIASVDKLAKLGKEKGWLVSDSPKPGDIFIHTDNKGHFSDHTGIIYKIEGKKIYTIEGNVRNKVAIKERLSNYFETFIRVNKDDKDTILNDKNTIPNIVYYYRKVDGDKDNNINRVINALDKIANKFNKINIEESSKNSTYQTNSIWYDKDTVDISYVKELAQELTNKNVTIKLIKPFSHNRKPWTIEIGKHTDCVNKKTYILKNILDSTSFPIKEKGYCNPT